MGKAKTFKELSDGAYFRRARAEGNSSKFTPFGMVMKKDGDNHAIFGMYWFPGEFDPNTIVIEVRRK